MSSPAVTVILPTYNRERFLPQAFASIKAQTFVDWELIVVDDGSTDGSRELIEGLTAEWRAAGLEQPVRYSYQENQGAYGARNTGLDHATGKYIAFFDSDDEWLPHHLRDCVQALEANPDVDWVYGACRIVDHATGEVLSASTYYVDGRPRPFLRLMTRRNGPLAIIEDGDAVRCMILNGLYNGLQNSVIRAAVFSTQRFEATKRNEAEDQLAVLRTLKAGHRVAYLDAVHVVYHVHGENSSAAGSAGDVDKQSRVLSLLAAGFESALHDARWSRAERRALCRRLHRACFWQLGYATLWQAGRRTEAIAQFRRGLRYWPWDLRAWKTYLRSFIRFDR